MTTSGRRALLVCFFYEGSDGVSTPATDTYASFTSSHITDRRHELTPLAFGKLAVQLGFWLIEDAGTGKWFMLKARCNPSCRKSLGFQDFTWK